MDEYQIWALLVDPFARNLKPPIYIENEPAHVGAMVNFFLPLPPLQDENLEKIALIKEKRKKIHYEYMDFKTQMGDYEQLFETPYELAPEPRIMEEEMKKLTFANIHDWLEKTGGHNARLCWWNCWRSASPLFRYIAEPLLSMRASGSMDVERAAKPLKNYIMGKKRPRVERGTAELLARAGLNMRLLHAAKMRMKGQAAEVYIESDESSSDDGEYDSSGEDGMVLDVAVCNPSENSESLLDSDAEETDPDVVVIV